MTALKTYNIRAQVMVHTIYDGNRIDISKSIKTISTSKSLYEPSGQFEITLLPFRDSDGLSWYHHLSPMDYIEIRITRGLDERIPILMRGFIDDVTMKISVDNNGAVTRTYGIKGRDLGKLLENTYPYFLPTEKEFFQPSGFQRLKSKWGIDIQKTSPAEIVMELLTLVAVQNEKLLEACIGGFFINFFVGDVTGQVNPFSLMEDDGSVYDLIRYFENSPWTEFFLVDLEPHPAFVFRKTPWKKLNGEFVQGLDRTYAQTLGAPIILTPSDLISVDLTRSDSEVKNYFFTFPALYDYHNDSSFKIAALADCGSNKSSGRIKEEQLKSNPFFADRTDKDSGVNRYGFRRFENKSTHILVGRGDSAAGIEESKSFNLHLVEAFKHNSAYENGSITLKGSEKIRPGIYIKIDAGTASLIKLEYYVVQVSHTISFELKSERWQTSVDVVRGTGFLETRAKLPQPGEKKEYELMSRLSGRY